MTVSTLRPADDLGPTISTIYRLESARLIGALARIVRDVGVAEELAQDALVTALEQWPRAGIPDNPSAWLMQTAKNRAIDSLRRQKLADRKRDELSRQLVASGRDVNLVDMEAEIDDDVGDDLLRLIFTACHPVLSVDARVALTLRLLGGLTTDEIARAFLVSEPTIAQRIVRAKRTLTEAKVPFEVPRGPDLGARLSSVLAVVYLVFNEGYAATAGDDLMRPQLCEDALRLGRILAELAPGEPEIHGLVALMELTASRAPARLRPNGEPVLLLEQDRARWDQLLIGRGLAALARGEVLAASESGRGPYLIQAHIAACHARALTAEATDWRAIASHYGALSACAPNPVVELNRAMAIAMAYGPAEGLVIIERLAGEPLLKGYHLLPSARADLLFKLGQTSLAKEQFLRAAELTKNERERALLLGRAAACDVQSS